MMFLNIDSKVIWCDNPFLSDDILCELFGHQSRTPESWLPWALTRISSDHGKPSWLRQASRWGDPYVLRSDVSAMCHVRTALLVIDLSLPPVRIHAMSCHSVYVTLGYRWLLSMNIWRPTYSPLRSETTAHLWHLRFLCAIYKCTYLLTYLPNQAVRQITVVYLALSSMPSQFRLFTVASVLCRLAFGNEFGVAVIDIVQKVCLLNIGTPDLYGMFPHLRFKLVLTLVRYQSFYITFTFTFYITWLLLMLFCLTGHFLTPPNIVSK